MEARNGGHCVWSTQENLAIQSVNSYPEKKPYPHVKGLLNSYVLM